MSLIVRALVLASAVVSTYFLCVRPMRRGSCTTMCTMQSSSSRHDHDINSSNLDVNLTQAREELALLHKRTEVGGHA